MTGHPSPLVTSSPTIFPWAAAATVFLFLKNAKLPPQDSALAALFAWKCLPPNTRVFPPSLHPTFVQIWPHPHTSYPVTLDSAGFHCIETCVVSPLSTVSRDFVLLIALSLAPRKYLICNKRAGNHFEMSESMRKTSRVRAGQRWVRGWKILMTPYSDQHRPGLRCLTM